MRISVWKEHTAVGGAEEVWRADWGLVRPEEGSGFLLIINPNDMVSKTK